MRRRRSRSIGWLAALLIAGLLAPAGALARQASPAGLPVASPTNGETIRSVPREVIAQQVRETYAIEEPTRVGGTLVVGQVGDVTTLNPTLADDGASLGVVFGFVYEPLVAPNPVDGQIAPGLADAYEIGPDGVTYTFRLNPEARWHDGTDLTTEDVRFSFAARLDPATGGSYQSTLAAAIASYRALDADTFEVVATDRLATFLVDTVSLVPIIPRHVWGAVPFAADAWAGDPGSTGEDADRVVGTGPFRFESREEGVQITLVRNDAHYDLVPTIDRLTFQIFQDTGSAIRALKTDQVDIVEGVDFQEVEPLRATGRHTVDVYDTFQFNWFVANQDPAKTDLFLQPEVRQALMFGLDRDEINEGIFAGYGQRAIGSHPPLSVAYAPEAIETDYVYDPDRARALLDRAGWVDSNGDGTRDKAGREFSFEFTYFAGSSTFDDLAAYLQQAWGAIGLGLTPNPLSGDAFAQALANRDFEIAFFGFQFDVSANQGFIFRCDAFENGFNYMRYCNPAYDRLDDQQAREFDPVRRRALLIELANIVNDDQAAGIVRFVESRTASSNRLHNFRPTGYGALWSLPYVWIEE